MPDKQAPKDWADQIAEVSHALGEGLFGKNDPGVVHDPSKRARKEKTKERPKPGKDVLVRTGPGGDYVKDTKAK